MKSISNYQIAKSTLKSVSLDAKSQYRNDKPMVRMIINDTVDSISRDLKLNDYQINLLSNYACKLHPIR
jgi:hypothetical protein